MGDLVAAVLLSPGFDLFLSQPGSRAFELAKRILSRTRAKVRHARRNGVLIGAPTTAILHVLGLVIHGTRLSATACCDGRGRAGSGRDRGPAEACSMRWKE